MAVVSVALNVAPVAKVREAGAAAVQRVRKRRRSWKESGTKKSHFAISPRQVSAVVVR